MFGVIEKMRKVAVLGNAGGGKSTLAAKLSARTGVPLYSVDLLRWKPCGAAVSEVMKLSLLHARKDALQEL
jgi:adenylate kinase family enzyme